MSKKELDKKEIDIRKLMLELHLDSEKFFLTSSLEELPLEHPVRSKAEHSRSPRSWEALGHLVPSC